MGGPARAAAAHGRGGRPDGRPARLHAAPVAARSRLPPRGAAGDPAHRAHGPRPRLREHVHRQRRAGDDPAARRGPPDRPSAAAWRADFRRATGRALPDPAARPTAQRRRAPALAGLEALLGPALLRDEGRAGAPDPEARPRAPWSTRTTTASSTASSRGTTRRLAGFADVVEADPYVSYPERDRAGRGRYNPGFGAKLLADLTGRRVRIVVQAFDYSRYRPLPGDLWTWTAQALRAGATDISFFASDNPRFTNRRLYDAMLAIASSVRGARLPAPPVDPAQLVLYATASEGQAQPDRTGGVRYRTSGDAHLHDLLAARRAGRRRRSASTRTRASPPSRPGWRRARTLWMPRGDTLDAAFAARVADWVRAGGTLIVTDPAAFTRTPARRVARPGARRPDRRAARARPRRGSILEVQPGALGAGVSRRPAQPADRHAPAARLRRPSRPGRASWRASSTARRRRSCGPVGAGRVLAFSADPMAAERARRAARPGPLHRRRPSVGGRHARRARLGVPPAGRSRPLAPAVGGGGAAGGGPRRSVMSRTRRAEQR